MNTVCKKAVGEGNGVVNVIRCAKERKDFYSTDFIALLNTNKGDFGKTWAVSEDGFPYFGENHNYVPEGEGALPANRTAIAFTPNEGTLSTIANQALTVDLNKTNAFGVVGTFRPARVYDSGRWKHRVVLHCAEPRKDRINI